MLFCCKRKKNILSLLEFPKTYYFGMENIKNISLSNELVKTIDTFCIDNNVYKNGAIVSLSGGVDSMVVLAILIRLSIIHNFPIYACSINYNNREEQKDELDFLKDYCAKNNIKFYSSTVQQLTRKKDNSGSRTEYEEESRKIRFDLYQNILDTTQCTGVFVGHHKDDIIENIFTNSMKGGNLMDLEVTKEVNCIHGVNIFRPLLSYHKDVIYNLSHTYNIPYFLDTTPTWSRRGQMRNDIFPLLDKVFTTSWRLKLKNLGDQSNEWSNFVNNYVIDPWFKTITIGKYGFIMEFKDYPKIIYINVLIKVMHSIHKHMLKSSSVDKIVNIENRIYDKYIGLDSGFVMFIPSEFLGKKCYIFNKDDIQKEIDKGPSESDSFLDGKIMFNKINTNSINKKTYSQMNIKLPIELIKLFKFPIIL